MSKKRFSNEHYITVAKRKVNAPPNWEMYAMKCIGTDGVLITGAIPRVIQRGPRAGSKTWSPIVDKREAVVTIAEAVAECERYEKETGNCGDCMGSGEVMQRWSVTEGVTMKDCPTCRGSKKATQFAAPVAEVSAL